MPTALEVCTYAYNKWRETGKNFDEGCIHINSNLFFELAAEGKIEYDETKVMSGMARLFDMIIIIDDSVAGVEILKL